MSEYPNSGASQFRADVPEQESVRTTIVGGRPPGSGQPLGPVPRGIEILLKKAVVDPEFRKLLLDDPNKAAVSIELELQPVEQAMLQTLPKEQLATVIDKTEVPEPHRRAFLGTAAATMLALLTGSQEASAQLFQRNPDPELEMGILPRQEGRLSREFMQEPWKAPTIPPVDQNNPPPVVRDIPEEVRRLVAEILRRDLTRVSLATRIELSAFALVDFRREIYRRFDVRMPAKTLATLNTTALLTEYIDASLDGYENIVPAFPPRFQPPPEPQEMHIYAGMRMMR
ncbi:MAG: Os1348 family NHLP clan protein [Planctomycetaceae bacterium]|nr:Os1348 family NHLP clan protein [Planctomycetaceae bacterium]